MTLPRRVSLKDGRQCLIRLIGPGDADRLQCFVRALSDQSAHQRFFAAVHRLSPAQLERFTASQDPMDFAVIAIGDGDQIDPVSAPIVGTARCLHALSVSDPSSHRPHAAAAGPTVEFAVTIADAWQSVGLGTLLLRELIALARQHRVALITGQVLSDNAAMLALARQLGFAVRPDPGDARVSLLVLSPQDASTPTQAE